MLHAFAAILLATALTRPAAGGEKKQGPESLCEPGTTCYAQLESIGDLAEKGGEIARQNEATQRASLSFGAQASQLANDLATLRQQIENGTTAQTQILSHARSVERFANMLDSLPNNYRASWEPLRAQVRDISDRLKNMDGGVPMSASSMSAMTSDLRGASDALLALSVSELANLGAAARREASDPFSGAVGKAGPQLDYDKHLSDYYGDASTTKYDYIIVTVPDPRVPRNMRNFDLLVQSIQAAMADTGYVFDRYRFPWDTPGGTDKGLPLANDLGQQLECFDVLANRDSWQIASVSWPASAKQGFLELDALRWILASYCERKRVSRSEVSRKFPKLNWEDFTSDMESFYQREALEGKSNALHLELTRWVRSAASGEVLKLPARGTDYGLMTYRHDDWRSACTESEDRSARCPARTASAQSLDVKAIYLVADRQTLGISGSTLLDAWLQIEDERRASKTSCETHGDVTQSCTSLDIIGPVTSGSVGSLVPSMKVMLKALLDSGQTRQIRLMSPTATATTNMKLGGALGAQMRGEESCDVNTFFDTPSDTKTSVRFCQMSASDRDKLQLFKDSTGRRSLIYLVEDSVWGRQLSNDIMDVEKDRNAEIRFFPPNIREVKIGEEPRRAINGAPDFLAAFRFGAELRLDADVGSEFTPKYAQQVTARTQERELVQMMRSVGDPDLIAIAATDVRDQLFMARLVRSSTSDAQIVFFGADELIAHPDFIDATRGAWLLSSAELQRPREFCTEPMKSCRRHATDEAALYYAAVRLRAGLPKYSAGPHFEVSTLFTTPESAFECPSRPFPPWYVATRDGLQALDPRTLGLLNYTSVSTRHGLVLPLLTVFLATIALWWVRTHSLRRAWEPGLQNSGIWPSLTVIRESLEWTFVKKPLAAACAFAWPVAAIVLTVSWMLFTHAQLDLGLDARTGVVVLVCVISLVSLVWFGSSRIRDRMLAWAAGYAAISPRMTSSISYTLWLVLMAMAAVFVMILCEHAGFQHGLGYTWTNILIGTATFLGALCLAMAYTSLEHVRDLRAALMAGRTLADIRDEWVGYSELPIVSTPFAAAPDPRPLSDLPLTPGLALLRRIRQYCGTEIVFLRSFLGLAMLAPIAAIEVIWLTPVPAQNFFLLMNLAFLVIAALLTQSAVLRLERDAVLSQAFCRQDDSIRIGPLLLTCLVIPVAVIAGGIYLALLPGVREWSNDAVIPLVGNLLGR